MCLSCSALTERLKTIGERAKAVRIHLKKSQQEIADLLGLSVRAWQKMERDEGVPSGETLLLFSTVDINPGWVLTGIGEMFADPARAPMVLIDAELMECLHDRVAAAFRDLGQTPPTRRITREAANLYNDLRKAVSDVADAEMVEAAMPMLLLEFKRRIERARDEPGAGKRSA